MVRTLLILEGVGDEKIARGSSAEICSRLLGCAVAGGSEDIEVGSKLK
jgi:hypothetical protein